MDVLLPNTQLENRYVITRALNVGGMGAVYQAFDLQRTQLCAIKEMLDHYTDPGERAKALQDFTREADMLADLQHPNIPKIFDRFNTGDRHYLVMEYVDGENLEELLKQRGQQFPEAEVVQWGLELLRLLDYLHARTPPVIYRDLKPANVMLTRDGRLMMIDFGIARLFTPLARGTMIGTPGYAPPEQYQGLAEPRSDLFALGATLHHLVTGRDPRTSGPFQFPPITTLQPNLSPGLAYVIGRALAFNVEARYPSAQAMLADLENYTNLTPGTTQQISPGASIPAPIAASGAGVNPVLAVDVKALNFGTVNPSAPSLTKSFTITNPIAATRAGVILKGSIDSNQPWVTLDTSSFNLGTERLTVQVTIDPKQLTSGQQSGAVIVTSNGGVETIVVLVNVVGPVLSVNPKRIDLGLVSAGQTREAAFFVNNQNVRGGTLSGMLRCDQPWGQLDALGFQTRDKYTVHLTVDTRGLPAGNHRAQIQIQSNGGNETVEIALKVVAPVLALSPNTLDFGELLRNQKRILTFKLWNQGAGILNGLIRPSQSWIRTQPRDFHVSTTSLTIQVLVEALELDREREYNETLLVQSNGGTEILTLRFYVLPYAFGESLEVAMANRGVEFR